MNKTSVILIVFIISVILMKPSTHEGTPPGMELEKLGFYSNEKSPDGEHSTGYTLRLWLRRGSLLGLLKMHEGQIGDGPEGLITNVIYDRTSGRLSFNSKLIYCSNQKTGSIDVLFEGIITDKKIYGTLSSPGKKKIELKRCCRDAPLYKDYDIYDTWKTDWMNLPECK